MPDGQYVLNDLDFEQKIQKMTDRDLLEFTARQTYGAYLLARGNEKRIVRLESRDRKVFISSGGLGAFVGGAFVAILDFFIRKG